MGPSSLQRAADAARSHRFPRVLNQHSSNVSGYKIKPCRISHHDKLVAALAHPEGIQINSSIGSQRLALLTLPHDYIIRSQDMVASNAEPGALKYSPHFP